MQLQLFKPVQHFKLTHVIARDCSFHPVSAACLTSSNACIHCTHPPIKQRLSIHVLATFCQTSQNCRCVAAADALARGAKALEDKAPAEASALFGEAIEQYEADGKEAQATDVFRQAIALLVKRQVRNA
jgi:hypothetical protein